MSRLSKFLRLALQSLALGLGAWLAIGNSISGGAVFAASFLAGRALQPIEQLLGTWRTVAQARSAYDKLNDLLGAREADTALTQLPPPEGRLDVEQLSVLNAAGDGAILANISFQLLPGEVVAVVGPSGAGKSTLLRMLAGAGRPGPRDHPRRSCQCDRLGSGAAWRPISASCRRTFACSPAR